MGWYSGPTDDPVRDAYNYYNSLPEVVDTEDIDFTDSVNMHFDDVEIVVDDEGYQDFADSRCSWMPEYIEIYIDDDKYMDMWTDCIIEYIGNLIDDYIPKTKGNYLASFDIDVVLKFHAEKDIYDDGEIVYDDDRFDYDILWDDSSISNVVVKSV